MGLKNRNAIQSFIWAISLAEPDSNTRFHWLMLNILSIFCSNYATYLEQPFQPEAY